MKKLIMAKSLSVILKYQPKLSVTLKNHAELDHILNKHKLIF